MLIVADIHANLPAFQAILDNESEPDLGSVSAYEFRGDLSAKRRSQKTVCESKIGQSAISRAALRMLRSGGGQKDRPARGAIRHYGAM